MPFSEEPINYRSETLTDPVALLQKKIDRGEVKLDYEPKHGYLKSVLEKLAIPVDSQTLVFSKTSFQYKKISPEEPRALYFNDDVYIGQVHDGKVIEVVSFDPVQGAIFYPPWTALARLLAPLDSTLGEMTTLGAAFVAIRVTKP